MALDGRDVYIVAAVRTPIGRGSREKGQFRELHPNELLGAVFTELINRSKIDPLQIDDVIGGCVHQVGEQGLNVMRNAWLQAGLPIDVPATTLDRQCGSGQQAVNFAASLIASGTHDVVIGAGVEHMGRIPITTSTDLEDRFGTPFPSELRERYDLVPQGISAEMIAEQWQVSREELDEIAFRSQTNATRATDEGRFDREIVPIKVGANGTSALVSKDQGVRPDTTLESLAQLKPVFKEGGKVTAGNSSQISDGAAALLLATAEKANELGLRPRARVLDHVAVGVDPITMLTGPIPATRKVLDRNGMSIDDIDVFEVNEAFASVIVAWQRELQPEMDRVNVNGGAIALGHPLGSTGARLLTSLVHELERSDKEIGLVTMCCGGGLGTATLIQRV